MGCVLSRRIFFAICTREQERDAFHAVCAVIVNVLSGRNFTKKKRTKQPRSREKSFLSISLSTGKEKKRKEQKKREREKKRTLLQ